MKKKALSFLFIVLFVFAGCQKQESVLESQLNSSENSMSSLSKTALIASGVLDFTLDDWGDSVSPTYDGYTFTVIYTFDSETYPFESTVELKVNGTSCNTETYYTSTSSSADPYWTGWYSINYSGVSMEYRLNMVFWDNGPGSPVVVGQKPAALQVKTPQYVSPDAPTGFSVSPALHPGSSANPVLSWSQTSDGDVTHVLIFRRNNIPTTAYSLIATISSSNTSYTDYSCDWNLPTGRTYTYKISFKDATHNLTSSSSSEEFSSSL